ncbi:MAG: hypothetical protein ACLQJ7_02085 [Syntrophobacteraceae bacterium]
MTIWFTATLFLSAYLLFMVQPMVGKMILPLYGGTPAVWNACMVFFQAFLLAGYAYAHFSIKWFGTRFQAIIHLFLIIVPLLLMPVMIGPKYAPPPDSNPPVWLLGTLFWTAGLPYFMISSTAPLLQRWFNATGHAASDDPYFLYAASNSGSLLALLSYPFIVERLMGLSEQSLTWTFGYAILVTMMAACALLLWRAQRERPASLTRNPSGNIDGQHAADKPSWAKRAFWIFCSFVPSSLMLSVTTFITTDIASMPLLWVLPLALYLLTFIIVFSRREIIPHSLVVRVIPLIVIPFAPLFFMSLRKFGLLLVPVHLLMFFAVALMCHGELARSRPAAHYLTEFYLWMSVGGVLGGVFNTIITPLVFQRVYEYPLGMVLACLILPSVQAEAKARNRRLLDILPPALLACLGLVIFKGLQLMGVKNEIISFALLFAPIALICFSFRKQPIRFGLAYGVLSLLVMAHAYSSVGSQLSTVRFEKLLRYKACGYEPSRQCSFTLQWNDDSRSSVH